MKKINFFFFILLFTFTNSVFAELSDRKKKKIERLMNYIDNFGLTESWNKEKLESWLDYVDGFRIISRKERKFIESLAKPLEKPQTFYHWHTNITFLRRLVKTGRMTSEVHEYLNATLHDLGAAGLQVGKKISDTFGFSSKSMEFEGEKFFGHDDAILIEVTLDKGYPVLDLLDPEVKMKLEQRGISPDEIRYSQLNLAVKGGLISRDSLWVLKRKQGVKFKAFTGEGKSLEELNEAYHEIMAIHSNAKIASKIEGQPEYYFVNIITRHVLEAAKKDSTVWETPLAGSLKEEHGMEKRLAGQQTDTDSTQKNDTTERRDDGCTNRLFR